mmetsp:Transcript_68900/g.194500  ORF Transcript_68900/g.194500 Transcript_68900/m.194500 type:complete len:255 (-) Transcript_68900:489-1253(-)
MVQQPPHALGPGRSLLHQDRHEWQAIRPKGAHRRQELANRDPWRAHRRHRCDVGRPRRSVQGLRLPRVRTVCSSNQEGLPAHRVRSGLGLADATSHVLVALCVSTGVHDRRPLRPLPLALEEPRRHGHGARAHQRCPSWQRPEERLRHGKLPEPLVVHRAIPKLPPAGARHPHTFRRHHLRGRVAERRAPRKRQRGLPRRDCVQRQLCQGHEVRPGRDDLAGGLQVLGPLRAGPRKRRGRVAADRRLHLQGPLH